MATTYPATKQTFTNPAGTQTLDSPDHAGLHSDKNDTIEAIEDTLGTTAGTSVLKHFSAGEFPARVTGVASTGTLQQTIVGGTHNNTVLGTSSWTGGTINNAVVGTPTVTGGTLSAATVNNSTLGTPVITGGTATNITLTTPSFSAGAVTTAAIAANSATNGSMVISAAGQAGTMTAAGGWANFNARIGTFVTNGGNVFGAGLVNFYYNGTASTARGRILGTSSAGTFFIPAANGFVHPFNATSVYYNMAISGIATGVAAGTYIVSYQGSTAGGDLVTDTTLFETLTLVELLR